MFSSQENLLPSCIAGSAPIFHAVPKQQAATEGLKLTSKVETDPKKIEARLKQIQFGKNTLGYDNYVATVPTHKRKSRDEHPRTPDPYEVQSKRAFDGRIKVWRRALHKYDNGGDGPGFLHIDDEKRGKVDEKRGGRDSNHTTSQNGRSTSGNNQRANSRSRSRDRDIDRHGRRSTSTDGDGDRGADRRSGGLRTPDRLKENNQLTTNTRRETRQSSAQKQQQQLQQNQGTKSPAGLSNNNSNNGRLTSLQSRDFDETEHMVSDDVSSPMKGSTLQNEQQLLEEEIADYNDDEDVL